MAAQRPGADERANRTSAGRTARHTERIVKLKLEFGAMAPLLETQLGHQGLRITAGPLRHLQKDADALARLSVRGVLSEKETTYARGRLMKTILKLAEKA